jgi:predicted DNA-binding WGR domain protein
MRLIGSWGRTGTNGQELVEVFASEDEAGQALKAVAWTQRRRGIGIGDVAELSL